MEITRVIGTKIRRRPNTSATRPSTRGWLTSERTAATRSRTLPTWSPWGSKIGRPTSRAAYTREGVVLTSHHATGQEPRRRHGRARSFRSRPVAFAHVHESRSILCCGDRRPARRRRRPRHQQGRGRPRPAHRRPSGLVLLAAP